MDRLLAYLTALKLRSLQLRHFGTMFEDKHASRIQF